MHLTFLEASVPLTKTCNRVADGSIKKTPYPLVWEFTSHQETVLTLAHLDVVLRKHAALNHCLLKGNVQRPLITESRAGSTDANAQTEFIVLDLDGLPDTGGITVDAFLLALGLKDVSYVLQWSASHGIESTALRAHVFMLLDRPVAAPLLKQWLIQLNHETSLLRDALGLTKTGNALSWALDISACQNDKLIYIAPPVLKNIKDPLQGAPRISLVKRKKDRLTLPASINSTAKNKELTSKKTEELRERDGLPKRKTTYKMHGSVEVLVKPDACVITEMRTERGFVYFNLNGGDSWAYYHPETNPDYIYNFKGEPVYLTKELLPEYWEQLTNAGSRVNSKGLIYLAFCDRATSGYWRGTYDPANDVLDLYAAKNESIVRSFGKQHGVPLGDFIPEWDLTFDPTDNVRVDTVNKTINTFTPTAYMRQTPKAVKVCPKTIFKVISNAVGGEPDTVDHFMNWVASILQFRKQTRTAWVLHGTTGTGKGVLMTNILRPLFGAAQTASRRMEELGEKYNHFMTNSFIVFVDEVQTKALQNEQGVMAKLKNFITEASVAIRSMYANGIEAPNYTNWIFASNMADPVSIDKEDRRFNVGKYQSNKLVLSDKEMADIEKELPAFHDYLMTYKADLQRAGKVLNTKDRDTMISISESSVDTVGSAILDGNFGFLMEQLPNTTTNTAANQVLFNQVEDYRQVLAALLVRTDRNSGGCNIARDELRTIFGYVVGGMPTTPNKFTSLLKHHRIHMQDVWINTGTTAGKERGIKTMWKDTARWQTYLDVFTPPNSKKPKTKLKAVA